MVGTAYRWLADRWYFFTTFFPVQLFLLHLRRSHLLIIFWLILFGFVSGGLGKSYGFQYLFLSPEYLQKVGFLSYFLLGATLGLFVMAFHISSYIYYSYRYPFLATLNSPLWKFSLNNSLIPVFFIAFLTYHIIQFSLYQSYPLYAIALHVGGVVLGIILLIFITFSYFLGTIQTLEEPDRMETKGQRRWQNFVKLLNPQQSHRQKQFPNSVINYYLRSPFKITLARSTQHYGQERLLNTIKQHHFSAAIYFLVLIAMVISLSLVSDQAAFIIPAGASVFIIFSLYLMVTGAFYARLKTWTVTFGVLIILIINHISTYDYFQIGHFAYGMDYSTQAAYSDAVLDSLTANTIVQRDLETGRQHLENWHQKFTERKPKIVLLNVSGGGLRSTLWTLRVLQTLDTLTGGTFNKHCHLILGSSGGMLGAAYFRELRQRESRGLLSPAAHQELYLHKASKDLLNPVVFNLAVSDLFFNLKKVERAGMRYPRDRGHSFDSWWNRNTDGVMDKGFGEYREDEWNSTLPTLILSPTIVEDGRKMIMSNLPFSYLTFSESNHGKVHDGVEYQRLFRNQRPDSLSFITALRMSASFPYITPLINLPSHPTMEVIDAGVRDNEGYEMALRYIYEFDDWLAQNTSGVLIIQTKANRPGQIAIEGEPISTLDKLTRPIGGVIKSFHNLQIYNKALLNTISNKALQTNVEVVKLSLLEEKDNISLSWHLTSREKNKIKSALGTAENQAALRRIRKELRNQ